MLIFWFCHIACKSVIKVYFLFSNVPQTLDGSLSVKRIITVVAIGTTKWEEKGLFRVGQMTNSYLDVYANNQSCFVIQYVNQRPSLIVIQPSKPSFLIVVSPKNEGNRASKLSVWEKKNWERESRWLNELTLLRKLLKSFLYKLSIMEMSLFL